MIGHCLLVRRAQKKRTEARFSSDSASNQRLSIAGTSRTGEPTNS